MKPDSDPSQRPGREPLPQRRLESTELFKDSHVVIIAHAGEEYRLLLTRNNRLILQK